MKTTSWSSAFAGRCKIWIVALTIASAEAGDIRVSVRDQKGSPIADVIVWAPGAGARAKPVNVEISQKGRQFHPEMSVIPVGSAVRFPNHDNVQHHVYSFSSAKRFDIPLYIGEPPEPVRFDKPGVVTLGCNIHDWMAAYILVLDTGSFARTGADGVAVLTGVPPGTTTVKAWHPRSRSEPVETRLGSDKTTADISLPLRPAFRRTPPEGDADTYR